jgi:hypothetical protein
MELPSFLLALDPYLIWFYRLPSNSYAGFLLGTLVLVVISLIIGEVTARLATRLVGRHMEGHAAEALKYGELSIDAAKAGDKPSYHAANKLANEAFGLSFFSLIALSMARLWPIPFVLAWMQYRFLGVEFPLPFIGFSLGFIGVFIILYAAVYFLGSRVKKKLAYFRRIKSSLAPDLTQTREPQGLAALPPPMYISDQK